MNLRRLASGLPGRLREHNTALVAAGVASYAFLALIPTVVARRSARVGVITIGAIVAMVVWLVVSALFAAYTAGFASYGKTYGALASIIVVLLWLWLTCLALLIGAEADGDDEG